MFERENGESDNFAITSVTFQVTLATTERNPEVWRVRIRNFSCESFFTVCWAILKLFSFHSKQLHDFLMTIAGGICEFETAKLV